MHEFGIVEGIVNNVLPQFHAQGVKQIAQIRFRRGSAFNEDSLQQAYQSTIVGTALQDAELVIDTVNLDYAGKCGYQQVITSNDWVGHMFSCPTCGSVHEVDEAHDLEFIEVVTELD